MVAYHFCQSDNAPTCLVPEFVHSLAAQMSQAPRLTPYYRLVSSDPSLQSLLSLPGCVADPSSALVRGVLEPLAALRSTGRLVAVEDMAVIVLDGLCDAEIHRVDHGPTLGSFLSAHLPHFPPWLKVICTVRSNIDAAASAVTRALPFMRISLDKTDVDERLNKDMSDYIALRISRSPQIRANITPPSSASAKMIDQQPGGGGASPQARITAYLTQVARGCFLYVKLSLDLLDRGHLVVKSSSGFNVLPMTLAQIYLLECNLRFPSERSFDKVRDLLQVALAALAPMTPAELFRAANALKAPTEPALAWGEFLMRFSALSGFLVRR